MGVRKTESRIPANCQASDLGEAVVATDGRCALVSFITSPLVVNRENVYVLFVTDAALAGTAQSFEWTFTENESAPDIQTTQHPEIAYHPQTIGPFNLKIRILDAGNTEQASLLLDQEVVPPSAELEVMINNARNTAGAGAANPEVLRELVNEHSRYYQNVPLQTPEEGKGFQRFLFNMVFDGALRRSPAQRKQHLDELTVSLNSDGSDFVTLTAKGVGVCSIRLPLLAMNVRVSGNSDPPLNWTELPEPANQRAFADEQLRHSLAALSESVRIDLFNIARFPKSNITQCGRILETLRNRYFGRTNFNDVLTGLSGTRAHWITRHFEEGPLVRS